MKFLLSFLFIVIANNLTMFSQDVDKTSLKTTDKSTVSLPDNCYKKLQGSIGIDKISVDLMKNDSTLSGNIYNYHDRVLSSFLGKIDSKGRVVLEEYGTLKGMENAHTFEGYFTGETTLKGTWKNNSSNEALDAILIENYEKAAILDFKILQSYTSDLYESSCICYTQEIHLIEITGPKGDAVNKINMDIRRFLEPQLSEFSSQTKPLKPCTDCAFYETDYIGLDLLTNEADVLCFRLSWDYYENLGLSNNNDPKSTFVNFNVKTGNEISLEEILLPGAEKQLKQLAKEKFLAQNTNRTSDEKWHFEQDGEDFEIGHFAIMKNGLEISFNRYQIGQGSLGIPEPVFIDYAEIKHLIDPKSVIGQWLP